jgi:hypothetical protein
MVEYSNLGASAAKALKASPPAPKMPQQPAAGTTSPAAGSKQAQAQEVDPNAPQAVIWEAPETPGKKQAPAPPPPPAVFVLANGDHVETARYIVSVNSVRVEQDGMQRVNPLSDINMKETVAANHARGLDIKFPTDRTQIMLGF